MSMMEKDVPRRPSGARKWWMLAALVGMALFMYLSAMYKIAHYGP